MLIFRWGAQSLRSSDWRVGQNVFWSSILTPMNQFFHKKYIPCGPSMMELSVIYRNSANISPRWVSGGFSWKNGEISGISSPKPTLYGAWNTNNLVDFLGNLLDRVSGRVARKSTKLIVFPALNWPGWLEILLIWLIFLQIRLIGFLTGLRLLHYRRTTR